MFQRMIFFHFIGGRCEYNHRHATFAVSLEYGSRRNTGDIQIEDYQRGTELWVRKHPHRLLSIHSRYDGDRLIRLAQRLPNQHDIAWVVFNQKDN